jgi:hypothetical protein
MTTGMTWRMNNKQLTFSVLVACACVVSAALHAQDYPTRPIRLLVGVAPGGGTDFMARLVAQKLNEAWGQPVVVDNRIGATGLIAMEMTAKASPDGYTYIVFNVGHMMSAHLARRVAFDPVKDFASVSLMARAFLAFIRPYRRRTCVTSSLTPRAERVRLIMHPAAMAGSNICPPNCSSLKRELISFMCLIRAAGQGRLRCCPVRSRSSLPICWR